MQENNLQFYVHLRNQLVKLSSWVITQSVYNINYELLSNVPLFIAKEATSHFSYMKLYHCKKKSNISLHLINSTQFIMITQHTHNFSWTVTIFHLININLHIMSFWVYWPEQTEARNDALSECFQISYQGKNIKRNRNFILTTKNR